ncbi:MAG TPA: TraR/DksA family transcriptional regulator [candidate division WOR-3 bacterium]|uniref:TraR/DksA family transcriptional regulator n=1 Tax=candidate division WOR-3 bacterium TaxID=2052148 RepID=A0A7C1B4R5_UNCW3|nr:TraR/DksA C4-type zinc finger protein [Candidatus Hydrothermae bacterium]HDM90919.1 TraR/DksA family transcriptional regulator [candidate division WOR-3 bacterium]
MKTINIERFKNMLLEEKKRILKNLKSEKEDEERIGESWSEPRDLEDWAHISLTEDLKSKLASRDISTLMEIEEALRRINRGTYGICEKCGAAIEEERLELIPWTRYCSKCAREMSR